MCGICGTLSLNKKTVNTAYAKPMADKIAHRGPDDAGYLFYHTGARHDRDVSFYYNFTDRKFKNVEDLIPPLESSSAQKELNCHDYDLYMGHRRLSILDLTRAGHQPMSDLSKNIWVTYNGEIYNFKELRTELQEHGHRFKSNTDTEVIIYSYIEWGIDCIKRFNGMFAFSLYDNFKKKFYLARDRYGIKPVYYHITDDKTFIWGSEIKSILEYKDYTPEIDKEALLEYFTFQNIFTNNTLHKDVKILEPGHFFRIDLNSKQIKKIQFWDFDFSEPEKAKDEREYIEELDRLFKQAVQRQLVSDVDVGAYLSGGMDSGSITAVAASEIPNIKSFTCGFDLHSASGLELGYDEREKAEFMSYKFQTEHYEMVLKAGDMERCFPKLAWHIEELRVGQSYPNYYASQLASRFVKVVLAGSGGDELFAGYPWRYYRAVVNDDFEHYIDKYYKYWQRLIRNKLIKKVFAPIWTDVKHVWTRDIFRDVFNKHADKLTKPEDYINNSLYFEAKTFLHGLLIIEDKLSMAHSLETRVPFLDNDLVDFAMKVPVNLKLGNLKNVIKLDENEPGPKTKKYFQKTRDGKLILRKAMQRYIPNEVTERTKQGFSAPDASWFKGDSIEYVREVLYDNNTRIYNYLDRKIVRELLDEHVNGQKNRRLLIWSLLNLNEFCKKYA